MKKCPVCKTTYTDDSLNFCLTDRGALFFVSDEEETRMVSFDSNPARNVSQETLPERSGGKSKTVSFLIGLLAVVILAFIGVVAFILLKPTAEKPVNTNQNQSVNTARVNSPGDGFLALRSQPDSENGNRITKIPHGASVNVLSCQSPAVKIGSRTGRWCQVTYNGQSGWAFDAWLDY